MEGGGWKAQIVWYQKQSAIWDTGVATNNVLEVRKEEKDTDERSSS